MSRQRDRQKDVLAWYGEMLRYVESLPAEKNGNSIYGTKVERRVYRPQIGRALLVLYGRHLGSRFEPCAGTGHHGLWPIARKTLFRGIGGPDLTW
jgi:hypothetical protein